MAMFPRLDFHRDIAAALATMDRLEKEAVVHSDAHATPHDRCLDVNFNRVPPDYFRQRVEDHGFNVAETYGSNSNVAKINKTMYQQLRYIEDCHPDLKEQSLAQKSEHVGNVLMQLRVEELATPNPNFQRISEEAAAEYVQAQEQKSAPDVKDVETLALIVCNHNYISYNVSESIIPYMAGTMFVRQPAPDDTPEDPVSEYESEEMLKAANVGFRPDFLLGMGREPTAFHPPLKKFPFSPNYCVPPHSHGEKCRFYTLDPHSFFMPVANNVLPIGPFHNRREPEFVMNTASMVTELVHILGHIPDMNVAHIYYVAMCYLGLKKDYSWICQNVNELGALFPERVNFASEIRFPLGYYQDGLRAEKLLKHELFSPIDTATRWSPMDDQLVAFDSKFWTDTIKIGIVLSSYVVWQTSIRVFSHLLPLLVATYGMVDVIGSICSKVHLEIISKFPTVRIYSRSSVAQGGCPFVLCVNHVTLAEVYALSNIYKVVYFRRALSFCSENKQVWYHLGAAGFVTILHQYTFSDGSVLCSFSPDKNRFAEHPPNSEIVRRQGKLALRSYGRMVLSHFVGLLNHPRPQLFCSSFDSLLVPPLTAHESEEKLFHHVVCNFYRYLGRIPLNPIDLWYGRYIEYETKLCLKLPVMHILASICDIEEYMVEGDLVETEEMLNIGVFRLFKQHKTAHRVIRQLVITKCHYNRAKFRIALMPDRLLEEEQILIDQARYQNESVANNFRAHDLIAQMLPSVPRINGEQALPTGW